MRPARWVCMTMLLAALLASPLLARPGTLTTRDGQTVLGDITETPDGVIVVIRGIASRYDRADVATIDYNGTVEEQFHHRLMTLGPFDVRGRRDLAAWASQQQRPDLAIESLRQARDIDPTDRDTALAMQAAQRQEELDELRHVSGAAPKPRPTAMTPPASTTPTTVAAPQPPRYRLLTDDEVNRLRQKELSSDDASTVFEFRNEVGRRYRAESGINAKRLSRPADRPAGAIDPGRRQPAGCGRRAGDDRPAVAAHLPPAPDARDRHRLRVHRVSRQRHNARRQFRTLHRRRTEHPFTPTFSSCRNTRRPSTARNTARSTAPCPAAACCCSSPCLPTRPKCIIRRSPSSARDSAAGPTWCFGNG